MNYTEVASNVKEKLRKFNKLNVKKSFELIKYTYRQHNAQPLNMIKP